MNEIMWAFNSSLEFDQRLYWADIQGSQAYARALVGANVLTPKEGKQIIDGLEQVQAEFKANSFQFQPTDEDIHTAVERRLAELIGPVAGKLHTGRSRNDQVATDVRLYMLEQIDLLRDAMNNLLHVIIDQAKRHADVLLPGYTHLQPAQPVLFGHWLLSYFWMLVRDRDRLDDTRKRTSVLPLGASALAGNAFAIDCYALAADLGFDRIAQNSIDAVSDRDFIVEFLFWASLLQTHLSRLAEDLILWSTPNFGFVEINERYATGSSIMPQKRNPDSLELLRGKTGRLNGNLISLLTLLKGIPSSYDKDLQEDKEPLFDTIDTLTLTLPVAAGVIETLRVCPLKMSAALDDAILATELADYLAIKGVPFRESHQLVGQAVRRAEESGHSLQTMPLHEYQSIDQRFASDLYPVLDAQKAVERRNVPCGTAPSALAAQIERAQTLLE
jgi:argininosuccinate lyase